MITSVLIANRGEIACRIIRTARRLNIKPVVVYSEADANSLAVQRSEESYCIGPASTSMSYLNIPHIIEAAMRAKVDAIHPGYGFLSENESFAKACHEAGLIFIGPSLNALKKMGSKSEAKAIARQAGIPVIPGFEGSQVNLALEADRLGFPLIIKPVMGGGGKGMRRVDSMTEFKQALEVSQREALSSFGNADVLLEKYIEKPRHIEVQIFGDTHGNLVHLFERDCSLQRRHQKVIEEAPSSIPAPLKENLFEAALKIGRAIQYEGAGTVEFLIDSQDHFYFMEMNTRLQVEHPVTEALTDLDLVEWQFRVASGETLPLTQNDITSKGHAIELRLYAEDPQHDFKPDSGPLWMKEVSSDIRIDTGFHPKDTITPYYDPLIAKLIVKGDNRCHALEKAKAALDQLIILGIKTNASFLKRLVIEPAVIENHFDVGFIDNHLDRLAPTQKIPGEVFLAASLIKVLSLDHHLPSPWDEDHHWHVEGFQPITFEWALVDGIKTVSLTYSPEGWIQGMEKPINAHLIENTLILSGKEIPYWDNGEKLSLYYEGNTFSLLPLSYTPNYHKKSELHLTAPMTGKIVIVHVKEGEKVKENQPLIILEAMKMEHMIRAPKNGHVKRLFYAVGDVVNEGAELIDIGDTHDPS